MESGEILKRWCVQVGICYIIGAVPTKPDFIKKSGDMVIAADGGMDSLFAVNICPDVLVGDLDSLSDKRLADNTELIKYPVEKDDTDAALALELGIAKGFRRFVFYGCIGGLMDHTLGNMALLNGLTDRGYTAVFADGEWGLAGISKRELHFSKGASGRISVLSLTDVSDGVTIKGLKYELDNAELTSCITLGVSNEFIGEKASIGVKNGVLCVFTRLKNFAQYSDLFDKD